MLVTFSDILFNKLLYSIHCHFCTHPVSPTHSTINFYYLIWSNVPFKVELVTISLRNLLKVDYQYNHLRIVCQ